MHSRPTLRDRFRGRCEIAGYVEELAWVSGGVAPALVLLTEGDYYAFKPSDVFRAVHAVHRSAANQELSVLKLRASVAALDLIWLGLA